MMSLEAFILMQLADQINDLSLDYQSETLGILSTSLNCKMIMAALFWNATDWMLRLHLLHFSVIHFFIIYLLFHMLRELYYDFFNQTAL